ncbi:hypothetical protein [Aquimarina sp. RZ0]|uniref:hypothetical protein n=1 Tax=Aquimarina sp. RZ0 TaxID=2607730 RepID=UPI0011F23497|nr:hypothetical protein [Aquimarina sp. RZ0]KAA1242410.1 hypothetical protein F0000_25745 [Aquimarina sp. RZ0]
MKIIITSLYTLILFTACAQKQKNIKQNQSDMSNTQNSGYTYLNTNRPGYYLQINNQNCYYEVKINDFNGGKYYDLFPSYSTRVPLNLRILKSGEQTISLKVLPYKGETLSPKAHLEMRLIRYNDMTDLENEYGGNTTLWTWTMPDIDDQELPMFEYKTVFEAEVPYNITTLDTQAQDLSKIEKEDLLNEVVNEFTKTRASIINHTQDIENVKKGMIRGKIQLYKNDDFIQEVADGMLTIGDGKEPQPIENYEMRLYYHNKVVTLLKKDDKEPAIWFKHPETGARSWQPVYLYKSIKTGKWERW